jgi:ribosome-associated protein
MTQAKRPRRPSARRPAARSATAAPAAARSTPAVLRIVRAALDEMKALDVREFDVRGLSDVTDFMVLASGTSDRHVKSIAERILRDVKSSGVRPFGVEGQREGEWVLVDLPDVLVHVMLPRMRELYALEQLWAPPARPQPAAATRPVPAPAATPRAAPRRAARTGARGGARPAPR